MHWHKAWRQAALAVLLNGLEMSSWISSGPLFHAEAKGWSSRRKLDAREKTRELWNHGFNNYMQNGVSRLHLTFNIYPNFSVAAFPLDEVSEPDC